MTVPISLQEAGQGRVPDEPVAAANFSEHQYTADRKDGEYFVREQPLGTKKMMRILVLGCGMSGLNFFKLAEEQLENVDIVCYEKNPDIGGTVSLRISVLE